MGAHNSHQVKAVVPDGEDALEAAVDNEKGPEEEMEDHSIEEAYAVGELSEADIRSRLDITQPTDIEIIPGKLSVKYSGLSQRGYYPDEPHKANQDAYLIEPAAFGAGRLLVGVFDGHGKNGDYVSMKIKELLTNNLVNALKEDAGKDIEGAFSKAFVKTDNDIHCKYDKCSGSTCVTCYMDGTSIVVANVGDSRAIMARRNKKNRLVPIALSNDQTPYRRDERARIKKTGARVMSMGQIEGVVPMHDNWDLTLGEDIDESGDPPRVWHKKKMLPGCAFTRSLGDQIAIPLGVCCIPETIKADVTPRDEFIVVASDGVWEFLTSQCVVDMVQHYHTEPLEACRHIVAESYRQWLTYDDRTDDISICLMQMTWAGGSDDSGSELVTFGGAHDRPVRRGLSKGKKAEVLQAIHKDDTISHEEEEKYDISQHVVQKTEEEIKEISEAMKGNFLFEHLNATQKTNIINVMEPIVVKKGESLIKEGDPGDFFYIAESGEFEVRTMDRPNDEKHPLGGLAHVYHADCKHCPGFGEIALLYNQKRKASVTAVSEGRVFRLGRIPFRVCVMKTPHQELISLLQTVHILDTLSYQQLQHLADVLTEVDYNDGDVIVKEDEVLHDFFIVMDGAVKLSHGEGHQGSDEFDLIAGDAVKNNLHAKELKNHELVLGHGEHFNEHSLLDNKASDATATAVGKTKLLHVTQSAFEDCLGHLDEIIKEHSLHRKEWSKVQLTQLPAGVHVVTRVNQLERLGELVHTQLGQVSLCRAKAFPDEHFTLGVVNKSRVLNIKQVNEVLSEKSILLHLPHTSSFFPKLIKTFADKKCIYSLYLDRGVTSLAHVLAQGLFNESEARFHGACMVGALGHLQRLDVLCQSWSPEGILVNDKGYPLLCDFRLATHLSDKADKSYDMTGSPAYFSPEEIEQKGFGLPSDVWGAGVLIYEMLQGVTPFEGDESEDDPENKLLFGRIAAHTKGGLKFAVECSAACKDLINNLLDPDENSRVAFSKDPVHNDPFFAELGGADKWAKIEEGTVESPHAAVMKGKHAELSSVAPKSPEYNFPDTKTLTNLEQEQFAPFLELK
jgi:serine/threonine protein phosphatase PrpC/CRP-like cAMP-binding protein